MAGLRELRLLPSFAERYLWIAFDGQGWSGRAGARDPVGAARTMVWTGRRGHGREEGQELVVEVPWEGDMRTLELQVIWSGPKLKFLFSMMKGLAGCRAGREGPLTCSQAFQKPCHLHTGTRLAQLLISALR